MFVVFFWRCLLKGVCCDFWGCSRVVKDVCGSFFFFGGGNCFEECLRWFSGVFNSFLGAFRRFRFEIC